MNWIFYVHHSSLLKWAALQQPKTLNMNHNREFYFRFFLAIVDYSFSSLIIASFSFFSVFLEVYSTISTLGLPGIINNMHAHARVHIRLCIRSCGTESSATETHWRISSKKLFTFLVKVFFWYFSNGNPGLVRVQLELSLEYIVQCTRFIRCSHQTLHLIKQNWIEHCTFFQRHSHKCVNLSFYRDMIWITSK